MINDVSLKHLSNIFIFLDDWLLFTGFASSASNSSNKKFSLVIKLTFYKYVQYWFSVNSFFYYLVKKINKKSKHKDKK